MKDEVRKEILVVDDTPANIDILMGILSDDYDVSVAIDGPSALDSVAESLPDIILLDVMMPGMDGYEVCCRLKQEEGTREIPVIFITAMSDVRDELRGFEAGAVDYITKPFSPPVVQRRVESALKLEEKTRELQTLAKKLSKYLSPQVYVSIFRGEQDVVIESRRKKLTIFFSDIVDFTSTTEGMETEDLTDLLNSYLDEMSRIALKHGGTIDKFIGDAMLIFFGDPLSRGLEEDALACVSMAIEMRERLKELQKTWYSFGIQNPFRVRTGISTGFCTVGNFGSRNRMDYTIIGSQVNIASRLESNARPGQILISHETWSLVKDRIGCLKDDLIQVKGISHPIQTWQVNDFLENVQKGTPLITAGQMMEEIRSIDMTASVKDACLLLDDREPDAYLAVVSDGIPGGLIKKSLIQDKLRDDQSVSAAMIDSILTADREWPVGEILDRLSEREEERMCDPVIVTEAGRICGMIPVHRLIRFMLDRNRALSEGGSAG